MSGWQVGDLALCVDDRAYDPRPVFVAKGRIYTVIELTRGGIGLRLAETPIGDAPYYSSRFVKVTPGTDIEGVEERRRIPVGEPA